MGSKVGGFIDGAVRNAVTDGAKKAFRKSKVGQWAAPRGLKSAPAAGAVRWARALASPKGKKIFLRSLKALKSLTPKNVVRAVTMFAVGKVIDKATDLLPSWGQEAGAAAGRAVDQYLGNTASPPARKPGTFEQYGEEIGGLVGSFSGFGAGAIAGGLAGMGIASAPAAIIAGTAASAAGEMAGGYAGRYLGRLMDRYLS